MTADGGRAGSPRQPAPDAAVALPVGAPGRPDADVDVPVSLVQALLADQHPDLAGLPLHPVPAGHDNVVVRLGDELAVRLPRRALSAPLVLHEQRWLPQLAPRLPLAVPAPVRVGVPGQGYPWHWSVVPWLPGRPAAEDPPGAGAAETLAAFLRALHRPAPADAPYNPYRGVPLAVRDEAFRTRLARVPLDEPLRAAARETWEAALAAPTTAGRMWVHGDLHPRNVLVHSGRISAVLDWGDLTAGDAAADLMAAWLFFDRPGELLAAYGIDEPGLIERGAGWAAAMALVLLEADGPGEDGFARIGRAALQRLAA